LSKQVSYQIGNRTHLGITYRCIVEQVFCPKTGGGTRVAKHALGGLD
jgi:hypothetical protein